MKKKLCKFVNNFNLFAICLNVHLSGAVFEYSLFLLSFGNFCINSKSEVLKIGF